MCTCAYVLLNVLGNIEVDKRYTQPDRYIPATWDVVTINVVLTQARFNKA